MEVISFGAGKQSTYMLLEALNGKFKTIPDFAIFSDTGCEPEKVMNDLYLIQEKIKTLYNFKIIIVKKGNLYDDVLKFIDGKINRVASLPYWTESKGLVQRQCTQDYKIAPLRQYLQKVREKRKVNLWIGISLDEIERIKLSNVKYIENKYPLIINRIGIDKIVNYFKTNNLNEPIKSACVMCPFHSDNYWKRLKKVLPNEFEKACYFDEKIRIYPGFNDKLYLHRSLKPLREIDFDYKKSLFPELIEECDGFCGL